VPSQTYTVSSYRNGGSASIAGVELNLQTPFTFLPGVLRNFGGAFNYTYTDSEFTDAFGFSYSFPGASRATTPGSSRPQVLGVDLPQWLIRIDYVFCSYDWQPIDARIGPWDGYSDHRPVIAEVALRTEGYVSR